MKHTRILRPFHWLHRAPVRRFVVVAIACFVAFYVGISLLSAHLLTRATNHRASLDPGLVAPEPERFETRTLDGVTLRGWYFPTAERRSLVICVHGMGGDWTTLAAIGHDLRRLGYDVLLFDLRGHGESDPSRLSMGRRERVDLRAVLAWACDHGFTPDQIGWLGVSMGASTLIMEGAHNPDIRIAVLDSPFGNLPELLDQQLSEHSHLPRFFNPGIILASNLVFGVRTDDLIPLRDIVRWRDRPLLMIHGEDDSIVPVHQGRELARAAGPECQLVTLPGVNHVAAYESNPRRYIEIVDSFFRQHMVHPLLARGEWPHLGQ